MAFQRNQQAYAQAVASTSTNANLIFDRDPTVNDVNYALGQFWQNTANESLWYLNSFSTQSGVLEAAWVNVESSIATLSDTANTPVSASSGLATPPNNIQLVGVGSVNILSDPPANRLLFSVTGSGLAWNIITTSQTLSVNNGYICTSGALTLALPPTSQLGDVVEVVLNGGTSFTLTQSSSQQVRIGNVTTTLGVGGSIASTSQGDWIELICQTQNGTWVANVKSGTLTVV
jgi:hypothetical protein